MIGFSCTQLVESLPGVDVSCSPSELSVKLQEFNGKAAYQWVINLTFQVSELFYWIFVRFLKKIKKVSCTLGRKKTNERTKINS